MKRIRLVVADDHRLFLEGVRAALDDAGDIEIVGEADSGTKVVSLIGTTRPDLVLMDFSMPQLDGLACLDTIRARFPEVKVGPEDDQPRRSPSCRRSRARTGPERRRRHPARSLVVRAGPAWPPGLWTLS